MMKCAILLSILAACDAPTPTGDARPADDLAVNAPSVELDDAALARARADEPRREQLARAWAERTPERYAVSPGATLSITQTTTDRFGISHVRFKPAFFGRPVLGYSVAVHVSDVGEVSPPDEVRTPPAAPAFEQPTLSVADALQRAAVSQGTAELAYLPRLRRDGEDWALGGYRLIYQVSEPTIGGAIVRVDAHTGEVLERRSNLLAASYAKSFGKSQFHNHRTLTLSPIDPTTKKLCDPTRGSGGGNCTTSALDANGAPNVTAYTKPARLDPITWGNGEPMSRLTPVAALGPYGQTAAADAHFAVMAGWDMLLNVYGQRGISNSNFPIEVRVHVDTTDDGHEFCNAAFATSINAIIAADPCTSGDPYTGLDVIAHELGHMVERAHGMDDCHCETGAMCEAFGDMFGTMTEFYVEGGGFAAKASTLPLAGGDWLLGEGRQSPRPLNIPGIRYADPSQDPSACTNAYEVHAQAGPADRAFYYLSQGVGPYDANNLLTSETLRDGMTGLGIDTAGRLAMEALPYLSGYVGFKAWRDANLTAAVRRFGKFSPEYRAVEDAFGGVRIGQTSDRQPPVVALAVVSDVTDAVVDSTAYDDRYFATSKLLIDGVETATSPTPTLHYVEPLSQLADGIHVFTVRAEDGSLNVGEKSVSLVVDRVAPVVVVTQSGTKTVALTANVTDNLGAANIAVVELWIDGTLRASKPTSPSGAYTFTVDTSTWSDGNHTAVVKAYDSKNNLGVANAMLVADNTKPGVMLNSVGSAPPFAITATATDASGIADLKVRLSGVTLAQSASATVSFTYAPTVATPLAFSVEATDKFGNVAVGSFAAPLDQTSPTTSFTYKQWGQVLTISGTASDTCGLGQSAIAVDGVSLGSIGLSPFAVALPSSLAPGAHAVAITVPDLCGNSAVVSLPVVKIVTPPVFLGITRDDSNKKMPSFVVDVSDDQGIYAVDAYVDNNLVATKMTPPFAFTINTSGLADGAHVVKFLAVDVYGVPAQKEVSVTADNTPPSLTMSTQSTQAGPLVFFAQSTDAHGVAVVNFSLGWILNQKWDPTTPPYSGTWWPPMNTKGSNVFCAHAKDTWGNQSADLCLSCTYDTTVGGHGAMPSVCQAF